MAQMVVRPFSEVAVKIVQTSSGSMRNVRSSSNVTRPGAVSIFAPTVLPIAIPDGVLMVMYGTDSPFVLGRLRGADPCAPFQRARLNR
jgi:hypothetical protein